MSILEYLRQRLWLVGVTALLSLGVLGAGLKYLDEDAQEQKALKPTDRSLLAKVNPFLAAPSPTPTPQLSKEYIYAGSRLLAVEDANANAAPPADLAVWRPSNGTWYVLGGSGQVSQGWGVSGDVPSPGDFDGDGKTDFSVYRPSEGKWYIMQSSDNSSSITEWGLSTDTPAPADYDGDGKTDRAVFRADSPTSGNASWYIVYSSTGSTGTTPFGLTNDTPAPADYDGDGRADLAVWRSSNTNFYSVHSSDSSTHTIDFSVSGAPVSADYDGDGKADYSIFSPDTTYGYWYIRSSITGTIPSSGIEWGLAADKPVPNDYDADGKCDIATWRNSNGNWYIRQSASSNSLRQVTWGLSGDFPVPAYFRR